MEQTKMRIHDIMEICLLAGKIMLESGAETYRVEDTMVRMAAAFGVTESHSFATPTGIIFSVKNGHDEKTRLIRITERTTDLKKVAEVNTISRKIADGSLSLADAYCALKNVESSRPAYPVYIKVMAAGLASGCFLIIFQGMWRDFPPAFAAGAAGLACAIFFGRLVPIKFFSELIASVLVGLVAVFSIKTGWGTELDKIIIGAVMPLVPGLLLTNAVRDLMAGHLMAGMSKGVEALLTAFAIGSGIALVIALFVA